ncbi:MAG: hypothetical protein R3A48_22290 [Polyangiales bacterium]
MRRALLALAVALGCRGATYPLPTRAAGEPLRAAPSTRADEAPSVAAFHAMETACRQRLRAETMRASLATMDRVRLALGSVCGLEYVAGDPLHWRLHCGTDDFFSVGHYALSSEVDRNGVPTVAPCEALGRLVPSLRGRAVHRWVCAGAVLHELLSSAQRAQGGSAPGGRIELAVLGHSDTVPFRQRGDWDACPILRATLGFTPGETWSALAEGASLADRQRANEQLSWCRAAEVARSLRCGLALVTHGNQRFSGDPCASLPPEELGGVGGASRTSVVGAGTSWIASQAQPACSVEPGAPPGSCAEARRVDVFVRFIPSSDLIDSPCPQSADDPAGALFCLQQCNEQAGASVAVSASLGGSRSELHVPCTPESPLPASWIRFPAAAGADCYQLNASAITSALRMR